MSVHTASPCRCNGIQHEHDAAGDRLRTRPPHRRPGRRQARGGDRAAQPLAPPAGRGAAARRDHAEEHPDDRPDRRRQDRDRAPPGQAGRRALHQGRGDQVHRGRLRRQGRRHRSSATWSTSASSRSARQRCARARRAPRTPPKTACSTSWCRRRAPTSASIGGSADASRQHRPPGDPQAPARRLARRHARSRSRWPRPRRTMEIMAPPGMEEMTEQLKRHVRQPRRRHARSAQDEDRRGA